MLNPNLNPPGHELVLEEETRAGLDIRLDEDTRDDFDTWLCLAHPAASAAKSRLHRDNWVRYEGLAGLGGWSTAAEWYVECQIHAFVTITDVVEVDPHRRGGVPVLRGTNFTVAQIFAELAETNGVDEIADNFDLDVDMIRDVLNGFSLAMQRPWGK